ncbi:aldehyde dehydrogenase family protein [Mycoplasma sp. 005V]|uniref:aldehyde dehydrogenase family protein n=1 Tax=unclassified Mycoplasma TaxID=2683645 RepID=UPI003A8873A1
MNTKERIEKLKLLKREIYKHFAEIYATIDLDLGKSRNEVNMTEILPIINEINLYIRKLRKWSKPKVVRTPMTLAGGKSIIEYKPYGTVFIITPWNYPLQLAFIPIINAFAAGNKIILKLSEHSKYTNLVIMQIINNVFTDEEVRVELCSIEKTNRIIEQETDFLFFTGSQAVGKIMYQKAASLMIPCVLELGGKNPVIITKDADLALACQELIFSKLMNAGQTCLAPDFIYLDQDIKDSFIKEFNAQLQQLTAQINPRELKLARLINSQSEARIATIANEPISTIYANKIILLEKSFHQSLSQEELFGPILAYQTFSSLEELINKEFPTLNDSLAAYIFTKKKATFNQIKATLSCGSVAWNSTSQFVYNSNLPFGGIKHSGIGKYHGKTGFDTFAYPQSIFYGRKVQVLPAKKLNQMIFSKNLHWLIKLIHLIKK